MRLKKLIMNYYNEKKEKTKQTTVAVCEISC